jgi:hypothetical protein
MVWRGWKGTSTSSPATSMPRFEHHLTTLVRFGD